MTTISPFHEGEIEIQGLTGERGVATRMGGLIQSTVLPRALAFIRQQFVIWVGIEDQKKLMWAFPLFGSPGFINPNEGKLIEIDLSRKDRIPDEWFGCLKAGKSIACLVIDLSSRQRIRINGLIKAVSDQQLSIEVQQSYPNCAKYIRKREIQGGPEMSRFQFKSAGSVIDSRLSSIIRQADTAFVASIGPNGADVSHRGGASGFMACAAGNKIIVPDYKGNSMFNTLGNFKANPVGGLLVIDFTRGEFLQLTGRVRVFIDEQCTEIKTGGTHRFWQLAIHQWRLFQLEKNPGWQSLDFSPYNP